MKWINVETQLPEFNESVLVTDGEFVAISHLFRLLGKDKWDWSRCDDCGDVGPSDILYWMKLPTPPCPLYDPPNNCNCHMRVDNEMD